MDIIKGISPLEKTTLSPYFWALIEMQKNIKEVPGPLSNEWIIFYDSFTTLAAVSDEVPWCSAFMCAAAELMGFKSPKSASARSWLSYGAPARGNVGDIIILSRGADVTQGHVGFLVAPYKAGDLVVYVLGGNQDNQICIKRFDAKNLLAFRGFVI